MKIFVSWSGDDSRQVAELLKRWLPNVIQEAELWLSSQDIGKGERWSAVLWEKLADLDFGILAITRNNLQSPWVLFEAGALSKAIDSRVIPLLCDVDRIDLSKSPLDQFQNTQVTRDDIFSLLETINARCARPLEIGRLTSTFDRWWPDFDSEYHNIEFLSPIKSEPAKKLDTTRFDKLEGAIESVMTSLQQIRREIAAQPFNSGAVAFSNPGLWGTTLADVAKLQNTVATGPSFTFVDPTRGAGKSGTLSLGPLLDPDLGLRKDGSDPTKKA